MYKATYWFFQWLKWCSCCGGHYAGRVDFGIDFNVWIHYTLSTMPKINVKCLCMRVFERERVNKWICLADIVQNNFVWIWLATIANWQPIQWTCFQSWSSVIFMPTCFQLPNSVFLLQRHFCCNVDPQADSSGNCTFVFCRCRCHLNVMTNQEDIIH